MCRTANPLLLYSCGSYLPHSTFKFACMSLSQNYVSRHHKQRIHRYSHQPSDVDILYNVLR